LFNEGLELKTDERTFSDYVALFRRRWMVTAVTGAVVLVGFVLYAYMTTPVYEATATIHVERPIIADETVPEYADQQLVPVTQRVLSTENVTGVIDNLQLYSDVRATASIQDLVMKFRGDTVVLPTVVSTTGANNRGPTITYAYAIAFRYSDAATSAEVANELARLHVSENSAMRSGTAARTSAFLQSEAEKVGKQITEVQAKIASLLSQGGGVIASQDPMVAAQRYEQVDRDLAQIDAGLRAARERKDVYEAEALQTAKYRAIMTDGQTVIRGEDRLIVAQQELVAMQSRYSEDHPDIVRLKREIASLSGGTADYALLASRLRASIAATEQQLATAEKTYSEEHPDLVRLRKNLESLQKQLADAESRSSAPAVQQPPDNPIYLQLQTRIRTAEIEINELSARRSALYGRLMQYSYDPDMDAKYAPLVRERSLLQEQYDGLRERYTQATLAESVESQDEGQVLKFAEPARVPRSPIEPNRPILILLGVLLGLGAAFGAAHLAEFLDGGVRGSRDIEALLHMQPLAMIPFIDSPADILHRRKTRMLMALVGLTVIVIIFVVSS
jgi:uncharacterized protein involved in exopolysaccharide biosynthesis